MGALTWDILKGLTFRSEFGYEYSTTENRRFWGIDTRQRPGAITISRL